MFGNKISESDYNEVSEKYLMAEAAYNNEKLKSEELQKTVIALQNQINEIKNKGIVEPELIQKYNTLKTENEKLRIEKEEEHASLLALDEELSDKIDEIEKLKKSSSSNSIDIIDSINNDLKKNEDLINSYQTINELQNKLNAEKSKNAILEEKLKYGGKKMQYELTQWEYKTVKVSVSDDIENTKNFNQLGEEGWEMTGLKALCDGSTGSAIFKRPKQKKSEY